MPADTPTDRIQNLRRDHERRVRQLSADADARIAAARAYRADLLREHELHKQLLREELMERRRQKDREELQYRRDHREFLGRLGSPLTVVAARQLLDETLESAPDPSDPIVRLLGRWLDEEEARHGIDRRECADPRLRNASAFRKLRFIEVAPRQSIETCLGEAHEVGHVLHPELTDDREVTERGQTISVPAEIAAWRWVLKNVPIWTPKMHAYMQRCILSYQHHATEAESRAIGALCSSLTQRSTQLRILIES